MFSQRKRTGSRSQSGDCRVVRIQHAFEHYRRFREPAQPFDIVFLDPPFASSLLADSSRLLEERQWLSAEALIYAEADAHTGLPPLPPNWRVNKAKEAGAVGYHLLRRGGPE